MAEARIPLMEAESRPLPPRFQACSTRFSACRNRRLPPRLPWIPCRRSPRRHPTSRPGVLSRNCFTTTSDSHRLRKRKSSRRRRRPSRKRSRSRRWLRPRPSKRKRSMRRLPSSRTRNRRCRRTGSSRSGSRHAAEPSVLFSRVELDEVPETAAEPVAPVPAVERPPRIETAFAESVAPPPVVSRPAPDVPDDDQTGPVFPRVAPSVRRVRAEARSRRLARIRSSVVDAVQLALGACASGARATGGGVAQTLTAAGRGLASAGRAMLAGAVLLVATASYAASAGSPAPRQREPRPSRAAPQPSAGSRAAGAGLTRRPRSGLQVRPSGVGRTLRAAASALSAAARCGPDCGCDAGIRPRLSAFGARAGGRSPRRARARRLERGGSHRGTPGAAGRPVRPRPLPRGPPLLRGGFCRGGCWAAGPCGPPGHRRVRARGVDRQLCGGGLSPGAALTGRRHRPRGRAGRVVGGGVASER